jgi:F-type H+-transporting ATPase subunit gamma
MSRRRQIDERLETLGDIRDILGAMKNLALMEIHKLNRYALAQHKVVESIESAAVDLLGFYPQLAKRPTRTVYLVIGSERGFCGDFNVTLIQALRSRLDAAPAAAAEVVAVGHRLWQKLGDGSAQAICLEGASVSEEVEAALERVMQTLNELRGAPREPWSLTVLHPDPDDEEVAVIELTPFRRAPSSPRHAYPPLMNVAPEALLAELAEQYLFAALHGLFYDSLMVENSRRLQHMDDALRRLEQRMTELKLKRNLLRQEEITEEIEVIMLSADALGRPAKTQ